MTVDDDGWILDEVDTARSGVDPEDIDLSDIRPRPKGGVRPDPVVEELERICARVLAGPADRAGARWARALFLRDKATLFAHGNGADVRLVEIAALADGPDQVGAGLPGRRAAHAALLGRAGVSAPEILRVEEILREAGLRPRSGPEASVEAQAVHDARTVLDVLPISPEMLAVCGGAAILGERARRRAIELEDVVGDTPFYGRSAGWWHGDWALAALGLWRQIEDTIGDEDVQAMLARLPAGNDGRGGPPVDPATASLIRAAGAGWIAPGG